MNSRSPEFDRPADVASMGSGENRTDEQRASIEELLSIAEEVFSNIKEPLIDHGDWLYDEHGLPK